MTVKHKTYIPDGKMPEWVEAMTPFLQGVEALHNLDISVDQMKEYIEAKINYIKNNK